MYEGFIQAISRVPETSLKDTLNGRPSPLLVEGGAQLCELVALAGLPGADGLPPPRRGIHGIRHLRMVAVLSIKIALAEGWDASRGEPGGDLWCLWVAGCLHDLGRLSDSIDWGHANRGATVAEAYLGRCAVDAGRVSTVARLIRIHGQRDEAGLAPLDRIFKDADALDRHRLSRWDLDRSRLRTSTAKALSNEVWELYWKRK